MKAIIFSAGLGTRLKPWTDKHPKALALVNGKSLLQRNIMYLQNFGIDDVIVNVHHFSEQIIEAVEQNNGWGSRVHISDESNAVLETGGGLLYAKNLFTKGESFLSCNVDILSTINLHDLMAYHQKNKSCITVSVTQRKTSRYLLFNDDNQLAGWRNTDTGKERIILPQKSLTEKAYSCYAVFDYSVFDLMEQYHFAGKFSLIDVYLQLTATQKILGFDHSGDTLIDVGKPENLAIAAAAFP